MRSIAVFCGASEGYDELYREAAYQLGAMLAERNIRVVTGGGKVGLMGAVAEGVLNNNGEIIGVIPKFLQTEEVAHTGMTELILTETMHERKIKMHELSDGVIILPGGWGTMDEMFEMLTWGQLGLHQKPVALLNVNGFYDSLQALVNMMVQEGFLNECTRDILLTSMDPEELLQQMASYTPPETDRLINKQTT
jgi:uncharacterized protein (TIGR00730 family)